MHPVIAPLDPADDTTIEHVLRLQTEVRAADLPDFPPPCRDSFIGLLRHPVRSTRHEFRVARLGDGVVGYLDISLPLLDNTENSDVEILVHPAHRRRGIGRALHAYAVETLRDLGRKRTTGFSVDSGAGAAFAIAVGAEDALQEVRRRLDLSTVDDYAEQLADARPKTDGYEIVQWTDRVPDEYAADVAHLDSSFLEEAPIGDLAWEPEKVDIERIREGEAALSVRGIRAYHTGAVHTASGRLVALTALGMNRSTDWHSYQWITLVNPDHRGHRLGMVVKLENLRFCRAAETGLRMVDTWNAAVNEHMIAINEAMGFRPVDTWVNWQQEV